jgi:FtsZ-interacting cell division protein ZipA
MRGTGYAIGEILIFLAIAAIIGFLIGWLVFYRRPGTASTHLSPANPNHVKRLEDRSQAVDTKLVGIEKRATALLETLANAPRPGGPAAVAAAPQGEVAAASDPRIPAPGKDKVEPKKPADTPAEAKTEAEAGAKQTADTKDEAQADARKEAEDTKDEAQADARKEAEDTKDEAQADARKEAEDTAQADTPEPADTAEDAPAEVDDYLSEADERISKLEETLDKLSEKLAELGDE